MKIKGAGTGRPHVPKDKLTGKKTGLTEQQVLDGNQEKRKFTTSGKRDRQLGRTIRML